MLLRNYILSCVSISRLFNYTKLYLKCQAKSKIFLTHIIPLLLGEAIPLCHCERSPPCGRSVAISPYRSHCESRFLGTKQSPPIPPAICRGEYKGGSLSVTASVAHLVGEAWQSHPIAVIASPDSSGRSNLLQSPLLSAGGNTRGVSLSVIASVAHRPNHVIARNPAFAG
jgi:hypothetical protein